MKNFKSPIDGLNIDQLESNSQAGQDLFVVAMMQGKKNGNFLELGAGHSKDGNNTYLLEKSFHWSGTSVDIKNQNTISNYNFKKKQFWSKFYDDVKDPRWPDNPQSLNDLPCVIQDEIVNVHQYNLYCPEFLEWHSDRPLTNFVEHDALTLDYSFLPEKIDYLQVDIDPPISHLTILDIVLQKTKFAVITFEHDLWRQTDEVRYVRSESRKILKHHGYDLVVNDVTIEPDKRSGIGDDPIYFEDWWANPEMVGREILDCYRLISDDLYPKYFTEILFK